MRTRLALLTGTLCAVFPPSERGCLPRVWWRPECWYQGLSLANNPFAQLLPNALCGLALDRPIMMKCC